MIAGIPSSIQQRNLEQQVLDILNKSGIKNEQGKIINSYDVVACHRLKSGGRKFPNVILRFKDRNVAKNCIMNKKKIAKIRSAFNYRYLNIFENLCSRSQEIFDTCKEIQDNGELEKVWSKNGIIHVKFTDEREEIPTKLYHINDIDKYFFYNEEPSQSEWGSSSPRS